MLIRQQGWQKLPRWTMDYFHSLYPKEKYPDLSVAGRYWLISTDPEATLLYTIGRPGGPSASATGLLGLEAAEVEISDIDKALPNWEALTSGEDVCYLPEQIAARLKVKVGDEVEFFGEPIRIAGIFMPNPPDKGEDSTLTALNQMRLLTGEAFTPVDFRATQAGKPIGVGMEEEMVGGQFVMKQYAHIDARQIMIVPAHLARRYGAELYNVAIRAGSSEKVRALAESLTERTTFPVFTGLVDGVKVLSATTLAGAKGDKIIVVPMIIGALIILNTMLGSVAERRREIHIYTSLGLAPLHVAALFLAEAAAFGTMGAMLGYVLGQGFATFISHTGILDLPALNYSSMSAVGTMMLVIGMVLVSSLFPARMAFKEAAPAAERSWHVPQPEGDHIGIELPFTIDGVAARGVCAFLWEWFDEHSEASIGDFATGWLQPVVEPEKRTRGLRAQVWVAPFDLGIVQIVDLKIEPTDIENIYRVWLDLERRSGRPGPWHRLNKLFLKEVRKQFLLWRALTPETIQKYIKQSDALFGDRADDGLPQAGASADGSQDTPTDNPNNTQATGK